MLEVEVEILDKMAAELQEQKQGCLGWNKDNPTKY